MKNLLLSLAAAAALATAGIGCGGETDIAPPAPPVVAVSAVGLSPNAIQMTTGSTASLSAKVMPSGATNKNVSWTSSDSAVATVTGSGADATVTAVAPGTARITVATADGNRTDDCAVTVERGDVPVTGVSLDKASIGLVIGGSGPLTAALQPANATDRGLTWSSSSDGVATVSGNGATAFVTGRANGTAVITATTDDGGHTASCAVSVGTYAVPLTGLDITVSAMKLKTWMGASRISVAPTPPNAAEVAVTWTSSNPAVATVTGNGFTAQVKGVSPGSAIIAATSGGVSATCTVEVDDKMPPRPVKTIAASQYHFIGIKDDGTLVGWGYNDRGQLANSTITQTGAIGTPVAVAADLNTTWKYVSTGFEYSAGITTDGRLYVWGYNSNGQTGSGNTTTPQRTPIRIAVNNTYYNDWVSVSCGYNNAMAIRENGWLYGWGNQANSRLGNGIDTGNLLNPTLIDDTQYWIAVASANGHTIGLTALGELYAWGSNASNATGVGTNTGNTLRPTRIAEGISDFVHIDVHNSGTHCFAVRENGELWAWGAGGNGRLGTNLTANLERPTRITYGVAAGITDWKLAYGGNAHSFAMRANGALYACGSLSNGILGTGGNSGTQLSFVQTATSVLPNTEALPAAWTAVCPSVNQTWALATDGRLFACGSGGSTPGIGTGVSTATTTFTRVGTMGSDTNLRFLVPK